MVTIEQKLSMFSKLLHRTMSEKFTEEMEKLRSEYTVKLQKNREEADREAEEILRKSAKRAEAEKIEILSRIRIDMKKDQMAVKEKLFSTMTGHLMDRIDSFIRSKEYGGYMEAMVKKLAEADQSKGSLVIYMTGKDIENYGELLKKEFSGPHLKELALMAANDSIIGGFVAVDPESDIRMDFSIKTLLEDNRPFMMQTLFQALEADGAEGADGAGLTGGSGETVAASGGSDVTGASDTCTPGTPDTWGTAYMDEKPSGQDRADVTCGGSAGEADGTE